MISGIDRPPKVNSPWTLLYSSCIPASILRNVVQPLPGFPITRTISPGWIAAENSRRIGLEDGVLSRFWKGLRRPKADLAADSTVGAGRDCTLVISFHLDSGIPSSLTYSSACAFNREMIHYHSRWWVFAGWPRCQKLLHSQSNRLDCGLR